MRIIDEINIGRDKLCLVALGRESASKYFIELWTKSARRTKPFNRIGLLVIRYDGTVESNYKETSEKIKSSVNENLQRWCDLVQVDLVTIC